MPEHPRIMVGQIDVTEHVAAMFDALVDALSWGSQFLDVETVESVLIVAGLAGFDTSEVAPDPDDIIPPDLELPSYPSKPIAIEMPHGGWPSDRPEVWEAAQRANDEYRAECERVRDERQRLTAEAITRWRAQVDAKVCALRAEQET